MSHIGPAAADAAMGLQLGIGGLSRQPVQTPT